MGIFERFRQVTENRRRFDPDASMHAGEAAELQLLQELEARIKAAGKYDSWRVWRGVRVPHQKRHTEIDFILATDTRVYLLEMKNWSGQLEIDGDDLLQIRRYDGGIVRHGDLMRLMRRREEALRTWAEQTMRKAPPIERRILFHNPRLTMSTRVRAYFGSSIASTSEWLAELAQTEGLHAASATSSFWSRLWRKPMARAVLSASPEMQRFHRSLDELGSWDRLDFEGGRVRMGDILPHGDLIDFGEGIRAQLSERRRCLGLDIEAPQSYLRALWQSDQRAHVTLLLRDGSASTQRVPLDAMIKFHAAGQASPELIPVRHLRHVRFGYHVRRGGKQR